MCDVVVLVVAGLFTIIGLWKGMLREFFGLLGVVAGYVLAMRLYLPCSKFLAGFHPGTARTISFIGIFLACVVVAHLMGWLAGRCFASSKPGFFSRAFGGFFGLVKGCVIIAFAVMILMVFYPAGSGFLKNSSTMKHILPLTTALKKVTRADVKAKYDEKTETGKPVRSKRK